MKNREPILQSCFQPVDGPTSSYFCRKLPGLVMAGLALMVAAFLAPSAQAQITIKSFQVRAEVPTGFASTIVLQTNAVRLTTNNATLDITGTNWIIGPL